MPTTTLRVDPQSPDPFAISRAADILRGGGLVAFPTETVYGLGAHALAAAAVARIFEAKGRPANNPVIVHVATARQARELAADWPPVADQLAERFWPGPLTLVLPRRPVVPDIVTAGGPTVAIRIPAHPVAMALLRASAIPVAAPSANRSSELSPTRAEHVLRGLDGRIDLLLDGGPAYGGLESTVLDLSSSPPRLLRPGLVSPAEIEALVGPIQLSTSLVANDPLPSPGLLARHYAPRTPLELVAGAYLPRIEELSGTGARLALLPLAASPLLPGVRCVPMPADPCLYAARLYAALHALDDGSVDRILVELPPDIPEWLAVRDRLRRAASLS